MSGQPQGGPSARRAGSAVRPSPSPSPSSIDADPNPGQVCVTCSDQALPFVVLELLGDGLALVDTGAGPAAAEEVSVALVDATVGDTVLVHAGEAIALIDPAAVPVETRRSGR